MTMEGKEYCHDLDGVKLAGQWSCSLFFKCPNQIRFWSMDTLEDTPCKCEDNDHLSERVIAVYRHGRCCKLCPRVEPNQFSKHFGNWAHSRRKNQRRKWLTWGLHFHGSNWLNALMGVGFCIHWIASQLLTIQTSGMRTISSTNRYSHTRKINFRFTWHLTNIIRWRYLEGTQVNALLKPNGVEVETERCAIRVVVSPEIVHQHLVNFIFGPVRRTRIHHSARVLLRYFEIVRKWRRKKSGSTPEGPARILKPKPRLPIG